MEGENMNTEKIVLNQERNVTLTAYLQPAGGEFYNITKRPAILVLPGGGYTMCSEREADPVALPYLAAGYQVFILRYSVGKHALWPAPLEDYESAMSLIRANAGKWELYADKVAVIGFSAGGHLAGCAAAIARNKPDAAILGYAAVEGETIQNYHPTAPDVISAVDDNTCPCFVFSSRTDNMVPVRNSVKFINALTEHDISYECHIYGHGPHGFSTCNSASQTPGAALCSRIPHWVEDSIAWLKDIFGDFGTGAMTPAPCGRHINGNRDSFLSADCTVAYLMQNEAARMLIAPLLDASNRAYEEYLPKEDEKSPDAPGMNPAALMELMTLREILGYGQTAPEIIAQYDAQLRKIPNTKGE